MTTPPTALSSNNVEELDKTKRYVGQIVSYNETRERGFIKCNEIQQLLDPHVLVYMHKKVFDESKAALWDHVHFNVHQNKVGLPQAVEGSMEVIQHNVASSSSADALPP